MCFFLLSFLFPKTLWVKGFVLVKREGCFAFAGFTSGAENRGGWKSAGFGAILVRGRNAFWLEIYSTNGSSLFDVFLKMIISSHFLCGNAGGVIFLFSLLFVRTAVSTDKKQYFLKVDSFFCLFCCCENAFHPVFWWGFHTENFHRFVIHSWKCAFRRGEMLDFMLRVLNTFYKKRENCNFRW